jgi:transposase
MPVFIAMEATDVYHEKLVCYLFEKGYPIIVVLPQRAKAFMKTLKVKTVTDKECSKGLTVMGLEKKLDLWQKPDKVFIELKQLIREREQIQAFLTQT